MVVHTGAAAGGSFKVLLIQLLFLDTYCRNTLIIIGSRLWDKHCPDHLSIIQPDQASCPREEESQNKSCAHPSWSWKKSETVVLTSLQIPVSSTTPWLQLLHSTGRQCPKQTDLFFFQPDALHVVSGTCIMWCNMHLCQDLFTGKYS